MLASVMVPIRRFFERRHMKAELERLRAGGELDQILRDADYELLLGDQGSDFVNVYRKDNVALGSEVFSALAGDKDEAIWWIVLRHRKETGTREGHPNKY
jgi:hypothetical protein